MQASGISPASRYSRLHRRCSATGILLRISRVHSESIVLGPEAILLHNLQYFLVRNTVNKRVSELTESMSRRNLVSMET